MFHNFRKPWQLSLVTLALLGAVFCVSDLVVTNHGAPTGSAFADEGDDDGWWWWWGGGDGDGEVVDENNE